MRARDIVRKTAPIVNVFLKDFYEYFLHPSDYFAAVSCATTMASWTFFSSVCGSAL